MLMTTRWCLARRIGAAAALVVGALTVASADRGRDTPPPVGAILVYHRFGAAPVDAMTVRTSTFRWQLQYLKHHRYPVVPLRAVINRLHGNGPPLPPRAVVLTADDGHRSVVTEMLPLVREYGVPVTVFVYPSAISNAPYAMTWEQLRDLTGTGLFDVQAHTYWHPNFKVEKRRLPPAAYRDLVLAQLSRPRRVIRQELDRPADILAWPFGIYDEELLGLARESGYIAGTTLDGRFVTAADRPMALPRFLVTEAAHGAAFAAMLPPEAP